MMLREVQTYENVELLPPFCEVDLVVEGVGVADVDERQVLKDESDVWNTRRPENKLIQSFKIFPIYILNSRSAELKLLYN